MSARIVKTDRRIATNGIQRRNDTLSLIQIKYRKDISSTPAIAALFVFYRLFTCTECRMFSMHWRRGAFQSTLQFIQPNSIKWQSNPAHTAPLSDSGKRMYTCINSKY